MSRAVQSTDGPRDERGFTLIEIMVALGILVFGVTALIGALGLGVSERRTAEQRQRAAVLADQILQQIQTDLLAAAPRTGAEEDISELEIEPAVDQVADGFPGLRYAVEFTPAASNPGLVMVTVDVTWLERSAAVSQTFRRVLPRQVPFSQRVERHRRSR